MTEADLAEARAFMGEAELAVLGAEGHRVAGVLALASAMGLRDFEHHLHTEGPPPSPEVPEHDALEAALMRVEDLPAVVAPRLNALAQRARDVEYAAYAGPTMQATLQIYRESPAGLMIFGGATFGLPVVDLMARQRSQALAEAERLDAVHDEAVLQARRDAVATAHEVEHARDVERTLRETVVPSLERLAEVRATQLQAGEATTMMLLDARRRSLAAQARLVQAEGARRWAEVRAWLMLVELGRAEREQG